MTWKKGNNVRCALIVTGERLHASETKRPADHVKLFPAQKTQEHEGVKRRTVTAVNPVRVRTCVRARVFFVNWDEEGRIEEGHSRQEYPVAAQWPL